MDRGLTADDVARALWRRPWVVLAVAGVVLVLGTAYVMTRPRVWKATSVVRVEAQQTDAQLVQRTVGDVEPRLLSLRQAMLGGPVLGRVVDELKLTPDLVARAKTAGYLLWVWPNGGAYENADGYARLFALGVDGVNASQPAAGVAAKSAA